MNSHVQYLMLTEPLIRDLSPSSSIERFNPLHMSIQNAADKRAPVVANACQAYAVRKNMKKSTSQYMHIKYYNGNLARQRPNGKEMEWKQRLSYCQSQEQSAHRREGSELGLGWCLKRLLELQAPTSVYFTAAICSVSGILQLFLKQMYRVCSTEQ